MCLGWSEAESLCRGQRHGAEAGGGFLARAFVSRATAQARLRIADLASAGLDTIALRAPSHPVARALLAAAKLPIAAPSANRSGRISPTTAAHVEAELGRPAGYDPRRRPMLARTEVDSAWY